MAINLMYVGIGLAAAHKAGILTSITEALTGKKKKKSSKPGGKYRLAVVNEEGELTGAACDTCAFFEVDEDAEIGVCNYWHKPARFDYVCDEYAPLGTTDEPVIIWHDVDNCSDWEITQPWIGQVAQPIFDQWMQGEDMAYIKEVMAEHEAEGHVYGENWSYDYTNGFSEMAHKMLSESIPEGCPRPPVAANVMHLQSTNPAAEDYFENASVLGLYQELVGAAQYALESYILGNEAPQLFPL